MKTRVLVTGSTGFVGSHVVKFLRENQYYIIGIGRKENSDSNKYCDEFYSIDISKPINIFFEVDLCIHIAGLANYKADYKSLYNTNVIGIENIIGCITMCKKIIYISSSSVYNNSDMFHKEDENIDIDLLHPYGKSKRLAELKLIENSKNFANVIILRPRAIYGVGDTTLLPRIINMIFGNILLLPANRKAITSLTAISNLLYAIYLTINSDRKGVKIYNVADNSSYNLNDVIYKVGNKFRPRLKKFYVFNLINLLSAIFNKKRLAIQYLKYDCILDLNKIKLELNYKPISSFDDFIID